MQRLLDQNAVPPADNLGRYFRYTDEDTGYTVAARTHADWIYGAKLHRQSNNLPVPPDFESKMESQLCDQLPPGWCNRAPDEGWVNTRFSWQDIANGMKAFGDLMFGGFQFVPQEEADRRARICATCYLNQPVPGCSTCRKITEFIHGDVANQKTEWDHKLQACSICHCALQVAVHYPMDALEKVSNPAHQALYPPHCWKSKESPNYKPDEKTVPN